MLIKTKAVIVTNEIFRSKKTDKQYQKVVMLPEGDTNILTIISDDIKQLENMKKYDVVMKMSQSNNKIYLNVNELKKIN